MEHLLQSIPKHLKPSKMMVDTWIEHIETLTFGQNNTIDLGSKVVTCYISNNKQVRTIQAKALAQAQCLAENNKTSKQQEYKLTDEDIKAQRLEAERIASSSIAGNTSIYAGIALNAPETQSTTAIEKFKTLLSSNKSPLPETILLLGLVGVGKTYASIAYVASQCNNEGKINAKLVTAYEISGALDQKNHTLLNEIISKQWLIIDDVGTLSEKTFRNASFKEFFEHLINQRHEHKRKTVITSNLNANTFEETYGERIWSRIKNNGKAFELTGENLRSKI